LAAQKAYDLGLVQFGENVQKRVSFICNCCGCCCEALRAARKLGFYNPVHTSNFIPVLDDSDCKGCGKCVNACPVEALSLVSANSPEKKKKKKLIFSEDKCLGCGVCIRTCSQKSLKMKQKEKRVITP